MKSVLITGATSFTGAHIARAFKDRGWQVTATRASDANSDLTEKKIGYSQADAWIDNAPFGSDIFLDLISRERFDVFVNHGANIKGYRQPDFDCMTSVQVSLKNAEKVFTKLSEQGLRRVIHSGSIFEPDEGTSGTGREFSSEAVSIYGVSKAMTWQGLRHFVHSAKMSLSKIIIPNPIGNLENSDRLIPRFAELWKSGQRPTLTTPKLVRDNLPAPWLAQVYVDEAERNDADFRVRRPQGFALSYLEFLTLFLTKLRASYPQAESYTFDIKEQNSSEPLVRINSEPRPELKDEHAQMQFWQDWFRGLGF